MFVPKKAAASFAFDYFLKDHLGNVRMVLTEDQQVDAYPAATMETAQATTEEAYYAGVNTTRTDKTTVTGYPTDNTTTPNDYVAKVSGSGNKIGPSITLKVMAGDMFNIKVSSWYKTNGTTPGTPANPLPDLLNALISGVSGVSSTGGHSVTATYLNSNGVLTPGATSFLNSQAAGPDNNKPQAYLNWILFDEQFHFVASSSGFEQVPAESAYGTAPNTQVYPHVHNNLPIDKNGYLYVYVSNATPNIDVFFDNLQVTHTRGPILEETHYYPFGLAMAGISSKAAGGMTNKHKYNGIELNEDFDVDSYDAFYRNLDPQIGRWWQVDPKTENQEDVSPYNAMANDPVLKSDPLGDEDGDPDPPGFLENVWSGIKGKATGTWNAVTHPGETIKNSFSLEGIKTTILDAGTYGIYSDAKTLFSEGVGKYLGGKIFDIATAAVTEGAAKVVSGLKIASKVETEAKVVSTSEKVKITEPYKRPSNATTAEQRTAVQKKPCVKCGGSSKPMIAGHKKALVQEYYETGKIDKVKMRSVEAIQPECTTCSSKEGAEMSRYSKIQKVVHGLL